MRKPCFTLSSFSFRSSSSRSPQSPVIWRKRKSSGVCPLFAKAASAPGVDTSEPRSKSGFRSVCCMGISPVLKFGFLPRRHRRAVHEKQKPFHGRGRRLSVRPRRQGRRGVVFTGAKRKPLTEEAGGSGAGFSQEGQ